MLLDHTCKTIPLIGLLLLVVTKPLLAQHRGVGVESIRTPSGQSLKGYSGSHALLIGVSKYTNGWSNLESIPPELDKVEAALNKQGFDSVTRVQNPNNKQLKDAFEAFFDKHGYDDNNRLLAFFSGHGYSLDNNTKGYLVPADAPNPNLSPEAEKDFKRKALYMSRILSWSGGVDAKHVMFLFDSCFSGTIFKTKSLPDIPSYISHVTMEPVRQFISAGSAGEEVPAKSTFTPLFVDAIEGDADSNGDGYVTGSELGVYLTQKVPNHARQSPQYGIIGGYEYSKGDLVFVSQNPQNQDMGNLSAEELSRWQGVRACNDRAALGRFVQDFPGGTFTTAAQQCIQSLQARRAIPLYIHALPGNAKVELLNLQQDYTWGLKLAPGRYQVKVSKTGYQSQIRWINLSQTSAAESFRLEPDAPKLSVAIQSLVSSMVMIPAGHFMMGCSQGDNQCDDNP